MPTLRFTILFCFVAQWSQGAVCSTALGDQDRTRLSTYVQKKYSLPEYGEIGIKDLGFLSDTCYRKLQFTADNRGRAFRIELVASPDLRFLTRELLDSNVDPVKEAQEKAAALLARLASSKGAASVGPVDAPVTMVLFSDFQCPFCSQMANGLMRDILPNNAKIRLVFHNYPLPGHPWARQAAELASCAAMQNDQYFWKLHDYLFSHQRELTPENLRAKLTAETAAMDGFDQARFETCVDQKQTAISIDHDIAFGNEMKVSGTPTLFINGQRVPGYHADHIRTLISEISNPPDEKTNRP